MTAPLYVTVVMILLALSERLLEISLEIGDDFFFTAILLELLVYMLPAAFYCKLRSIDFLKSSRVRFSSISDIPFIISVFLLYFFGMIFLLYLGASESTASDVALTLQAVPRTDSVFVSLCYVVIPAFAEEMLFRSVLLSEYSSCRGFWAITITSMFFAMLHFSFTAFPSYLWGGMMFGLLTYVTGSSIPAVILHMLSNFITLNFSYSISDFLNTADNSVVLIFLMSTLLVLSLYFTVSSLQTIYENRADLYADGSLEGSRRDAVKRLSKAGRIDKKAKSDSNEKRNLKDMFLSPTVLLAIFVFVFITLGTL